MPTDTMKGADIEAQKLCRSYRMGQSEIRAVNYVSFLIQSGEFVALLGTSGSGKSSLLNLIAGLDTPSAGSVSVDGRDLARMSREQLARYRRSTVGMVFQAFNLVAAMTVLENVELPMRFAEVPRDQRLNGTRTRGLRPSSQSSSIRTFWRRATASFPSTSISQLAAVVARR